MRCASSRVFGVRNRAKLKCQDASHRQLSDVPLYTGRELASSIYLIYYCIAAASRLLRITTGSELQLRIPAGSAWNIGLKLRVFALDLIFLQTKDRKTCFLGPKTRQLSKTPGNFRKRTGTSPKHPGHFPNTPGTSRTHPGNFPNIPGTSQTHPELPKNTRNIPERPGNFPKHPWNFPKHPSNTGELPKNTRVGGGWWAGGWTGGFPQHPGKVLREWAGLPRGTCDTCQSLIGRRRI